MMKVKDVVAVLSRFFALYVLYQLLSQALPLMLSSIFSINVNFKNSIVPALSIFLFNIVVFLLFWFKSDLVAGIILGQKSENRIETKIEIEDIETSGFSIVGMFLVATAAPQILSAVALARGNFAERYLELGISVVIGLMLIFGASSIHRVVKRVRSW